MRLLDMSRIALSSSLVALAACSTSPSITAEPPTRAAEQAVQGDNGTLPQNAPTRSMTADTDPAQIVVVTLAGYETGSVKIADGPFVLTSAYSNYGGFVVSIADGDDCTDPTAAHYTVLLPTVNQNQAQAQGVHVAVPAGKVMCSDQNSGGPRSFSGFKLYQ